MKVFFGLLLCTLLANAGFAQITEHYTPQQGSLRIGPGNDDVLKYNEKGYTLYKAPKGNNAVIIVLNEGRVDLAKAPERQLHQHAMPKGFSVLYVSTGIPVDLYFSKSSIVYVDSLINEVLNANGLKNADVFFLGVNLAGHRALKMIEHYYKFKPRFRVRGVVLCDGVLDWVRMWYECKKAVRDNFSESSVFEAKMITYLLEQNIGGTPKDKLQLYLDLSPYSYFDESKGQVDYLNGIAIRAYTEPAPYYWMEAKRKSTFDTNYPDITGIVTEAKLAGNKNAELHVFTQPKENMERRNPDYTWGLVDKRELVEWMLKQIK